MDLKRLSDGAPVHGLLPGIPTADLDIGQAVEFLLEPVHLYPPIITAMPNQGRVCVGRAKQNLSSLEGEGTPPALGGDRHVGYSSVTVTSGQGKERT